MCFADMTFEEMAARFPCPRHPEVICSYMFYCPLCEEALFERLRAEAITQPPPPETP